MNQFIGYAMLEQLVAVMNIDRPVYASPITKPGKPGDYGIRLDRYEIVVAQPDQYDDVQYCIVPIARVQALAGVEDFDGNKAKYLKRQEQAWQIIRDWLAGVIGFEVREAVLAMPADYQFLDGWFGGLKWNKETQEFEVEPPLVEMPGFIG